MRVTLEAPTQDGIHRSPVNMLGCPESRSAIRVLLVDDRAENRQSLATLLVNGGYAVQDAADVLEAIARLRALPTDVVLADVRIEAEDDGLRLLRTIKGELPHLPVILYTGFPRIGDAVLAMKLGASDYLEFPIDPDEILLAITNAVEGRRNPAAALDPQGRIPKPPHDIVATSPAMRSVLYWVERIGPTDLTVLLTGETGTGKELVARALHATSDRRTRPFVPVNCGAIPEGLCEAELFGYCKGAFTGAFSHKPGLFEEAHCGTLFLDEIGELPLTTQVRLLRFLEGGELRRIGETKARNVDVRVIAATNRDLRDELAVGRFRSDLYFRLNVAKCCIPPLRDRPEDLQALIDVWLPRLARRMAPGVRGVSPDALALLRSYSWPGNVRELRNVLEHALSLASGDLVTELELASALGSWVRIETGSSAESSDQEKRERLMIALEKYRWKLGRTAAALGMSRSTLWRQLKKYGIATADESR